MSLSGFKSKLTNGFVNCHAHIDRAGTVRFTNKEFIKKHLQEKWKLVNEVKQTLSQHSYYENILSSCLKQKEFNTNTIISFIDLDSTIHSKALLGAVRAKEELKNHGVS